MQIVVRHFVFQLVLASRPFVIRGFVSPIVRAGRLCRSVEKILHGQKETLAEGL